MTNSKQAAAFKMALGAFRMGSAVATATGHGLLGSFLGQHHLTRAALPLAKAGLEGGKRQFEEGFAEWKEAE